MTAPWQRTFAEFVGPGRHHPSSSMRVADDEARELLLGLEGLAWQPPVHAGNGRHAGYTIRNAASEPVTALFLGAHIVGFYAGSYLWIAGPHRGRGLSVPLILAAAEARDGTVLPPGVIVQGFTPHGLAAHRAAHTHAVLTAAACALPVPSRVLDELRPDLDHPEFPAEISSV